MINVEHRRHVVQAVMPWAEAVVARLQAMKVPDVRMVARALLACGPDITPAQVVALDPHAIVLLKDFHQVRALTIIGDNGPLVEDALSEALELALALT